MKEDQSEGDEEAWAPSWDQSKADAALGKMLLAGVTTLAPDGVTVLRHEQFFGTIVGTDEKTGVTVELRGARAGERVTLPPDLSLFTPAAPGEYRLRSTGEVVTDPDCISPWTLTQPVSH